MTGLMEKNPHNQATHKSIGGVGNETPTQPRTPAERKRSTGGGAVNCLPTPGPCRAMQRPQQLCRRHTPKGTTWPPGSRPPPNCPQQTVDRATQLPRRSCRRLQSSHPHRLRPPQFQLPAVTDPAAARTLERAAEEPPDLAASPPSLATSAAVQAAPQLTSTGQTSSLFVSSRALRAELLQTASSGLRWCPDAMRQVPSVFSSHLAHQSSLHCHERCPGHGKLMFWKSIICRIYGVTTTLRKGILLFFSPS